jgi:hypothetical protein
VIAGVPPCQNAAPIMHNVSAVTVVNPVTLTGDA